MTPGELKAKAESGDAAAQYAYAALLQKSGDAKGEALWLERAARGGHPAAAYTKAALMLERPQRDMDVAGAVALLDAAVAKGGLAAARLMAVLKAFGLGVASDWDGAVRLVARAAGAGHPGAVRELGMLGLFCGAPQEAAQAALRDAALKGDAASAVLGLRLGGVFGPGETGDLKRRLAGWPLVDRAEGPAKEAPVLLKKHVDALAAAARTTPVLKARRRMLHDASPAVAALGGLLPRIFCDYLILASEPLMTPSAVVDSKEGRASHAEFRTSDGCLIGVANLDLALFAVHRALCDACGFEIAQSELMGLLRYRPGQEYKPHFDFLPDDPSDYSEVRRTGQRVATLILVLDDRFEGGETLFPRLGISWRGDAGDGIFFRNTDENERPFRDSLHAGAPVAAGEKRIVTLWFRARRFWFWD